MQPAQPAAQVRADTGTATRQISPQRCRIQPEARIAARDPSELEQKVNAKPCRAAKAWTEHYPVKPTVVFWLEVRLHAAPPGAVSLRCATFPTRRRKDEEVRYRHSCRLSD